MTLELKVPEVGESITEVQIGAWKKREGDAVSTDEPIVEIESDKATVELPAPAAGTISKILKASGEKARVGEVIGTMEPAGSGAAAAAPAPGGPGVVDVRRKEGRTDIGSVQPAVAVPPRVMPSAGRVLGEAGLSPAAVPGTGPGGRITKSDAVAAVTQTPSRPAAPAPAVQAAAPAPRVPSSSGGTREERYVLISPIRRRIAERLVEAQQQAALLTTFNEVDMSAVMALRGRFKDVFQERYGVKLGFMSFFVRATVEALRAVPQVNAE
ncbi:MAG: dihydrolipoamide succinyltransferase, partial [Planctomycetia bacterium]|nr:dihydrolipoamide succinyltransferase [Planctomycetia bacterium]